MTRCQRNQGVEQRSRKMLKALTALSALVFAFVICASFNPRFLSTSAVRATAGLSRRAIWA